MKSFLCLAILVSLTTPTLHAQSLDTAGFSTAEIGGSTGAAFSSTTAGFDIFGGGSGISGPSDQFSFAFQNFTNNFDVQVRVSALGFAGTWTRAGLMARNTSDANAAFAASFATPGPAGCHFESRTGAGASTTIAGTFPVNYPDTWLRLQRVGSIFSGYGSLDGSHWEFLGSSTISMSNVLQVGFALTAGNANSNTAAQFRDFAEASGAISTNAPLPFEPPGPCSRRTALAITEIMYNPLDAWAGTNNLEFVELWNSGLITEDLTGHKLAGEISYSFPNGTTIAPGQFLVIAKDPVAAQSFYGVNCLGPYSGKLSNGGGALRLLNELGGRLLEIEYDNKSPWPVAADGTGHSLVLSRPCYGENDPRAWSPSDVIGGSPGRFDHYGIEPARGVVINEFLAHTDLPQVDYIELFNTGSQPVDLSGAWLSDDASTNKFRIPNGTTIAARGFLGFTETQLGFALSADGERIFLVNSNRTRVLDALAFDGQENGVSFGRYPDGAPGFQRLSTVTFAAANSAPRQSPVVINEIMYHPISEDDNDEYVEIYNRSGVATNIGGWKLQGGISYTFPSNTVLSAGGYLVVAANRTNLISKYPQLNTGNTLGDFSGKLSNSGERIALAMWDDLKTTNEFGLITTNFFFITLDEVTYTDGGRWGKWSDGGGSSLELIDPDADTRLGANWADSDESAKAGWTTIDTTDVLENGQSFVDEGAGGYGVANRMELFLQGDGEALIDNIEFRNNGGANLVSNGDFNSGTSGWTLGGVMRTSSAEAGVGVGNSTALHLRATGRGDTGPNKVFRALTSTAATGAPNTGTIRAQVRWLKGSPYILLRPRGNWTEVSQRLDIPTNLGTPGLPNSRLVANAGPAITDVSHAPVLPAAFQPVVVTARANDPDGIATMQLHYRLDPSLSYAVAAMTNDNGVFSATIPGQISGRLVAFYISATDALGATTRFPAETVRECLVHWGDPSYAGNLGTYRLWVTSSNVTFWGNREKNANDPLDATFVYGNSRVVYNVDTMYSGSPFHAPNYDTPTGFACDYEVNFPADDKFLGSEPFVLTAYDVASGSFFFNDDSAQVDLTGNWIARKLGQQYDYRRHIHVVFNGQHRGTIYDDAQQPNGEMIEEYFPDDEHGQLRKIESWFEFADDGLSQGSVYTTIKRFNKSNGEIDTKRYRWNWRPRATENPNDWAPLTNLIAVVNATSAPDYVSQVRTWMDIPNFLGPIIAHHICGSWDSYDYERGKNMFAYKPDSQPWRLQMWDIELALGAGGKDATDSIYNMFDKTLLFMITNVPAFHREYLRGFQEALNTSLVPGAVDQALDERYAAFQEDGVPLISPQFIKSYLLARRSYLLNVIPNASFTISNPGYQVVTASNVLVLTGTAPLSVETILVNSNAYPVTWTSTTSWRLSVPLSAGINILNIAAEDRYGNLIGGASGSVTANYAGGDIAPEGSVVFNEIQYQPGVDGAEFVELFNTHSNYTFDLSGWIVNGIDYTFPPGAILPPRSYLVLAKDPFALNAAYGAVAYDAYDGKLDRDGETLTLFRPGEGTNVIVVDRVRYEAAAPWPKPVNGASLQLVDANQDNCRVANWAMNTNMAASPPQPFQMLAFTDSWRYMQVSNLDGVNWIAPGYNDQPWPSGGGLLAYEVNSQITPLIHTTLNRPGLATGNVSAGHAYYFRTTVVVTNDLTGYEINASAYVDDGAIFYVNGTEISPRIRMNAGAVSNTTLANSLPPGGDATSPDTFTIPGSAFSVGTNVIAVEVHQRTTDSSDIVFGLQLEAVYTGGPMLVTCTPGRANSVIATLPPFPPIWLNELQANNVTGPTDNFGERDPWTEIFNSASTNFSLAGYFLTDNYTNLTQWPLPAGASVAANGFNVVWCDNQTNQTSGGVLHAPFKLASASGSLALTRIVNSTTQVVDYLNYTNVPANWSYGDVPDGQPFYRLAMFHITPGATNNGASPPLNVFINEWLADNTTTLADPADGQYEDWLELYNPGATAVDIGGYFLTDDLDDPFQFQIPNNGHYVIPAGGFLLVWADNETSQNSTNRADLHVNFALSKGGEAIGMFAADGTTIDAVTFGAQTSNISEGRFPNGAANVYSMPTPTPRASNVVPNTPPVIAAISNRVVTVGQTLTFTVNATDDDLPSQSLAFSLSNAPSGAQIGSSSGVFTWTPSAAFMTNTIGAVVADDGTPSLSDSTTFTVVVAPLPVVTGAGIHGNEFVFTWTSSEGQRFQVRYKTNLDDSIWLPASGIITGDGSPQSFTNAIGLQPQRYFQIEVLP